VLDLSVHALTLPPLDGVSIAFERNTHTAIVGRGGAGASTLLRVIAGQARPAAGKVLIGARDVTGLSARRRPLLTVTSSVDVPLRWSVQHALVAAARGRTLDREDRHHEYELAVGKWRLGALLERPLGALSSSERTLVHLARIELLRPAIVIADRLFEALNPAMLADVADDFHRALRVIGTTLISAPATRFELGLMDTIVVLEEGRVVQRGAPAEVFASPVSEAAAEATGEINVVPVSIRGGLVESPIGMWELASPPFQGSGVALVRPEDFGVAGKGEDSDLIFGVEEASFRDGRWHVHGLLSGGIVLRVILARETAVHKGRLLALRYDPSRFRILPREGAPKTAVPTDVVPPLRESR
jgi:ABC-type Fe3+/spermidine/putrescine transport system ATPase subunit